MGWKETEIYYLEFNLFSVLEKGEGGEDYNFNHRPSPRCQAALSVLVK